METIRPSLPLILAAGRIQPGDSEFDRHAAHAIGDVVREEGTDRETSKYKRRTAGWAEIRVQDSGSGIPEGVETVIFDPFFIPRKLAREPGRVGYCTRSCRQAGGTSIRDGDGYRHDLRDRLLTKTQFRHKGGRCVKTHSVCG